ncbi:unnamed protein product [Cyprideis torosa]|uniref:Cleavage stimulation factor 50 kDa subunit n=1 Tax=Cyprideis torosa TaxID=163714 RepID=A0A7R8WE34_9CRUS|nr:unnamed protein product [Cyprideis torosa]CAG0893890.1 unnamed protein product [Cyprideis torosa]
MPTPSKGSSSVDTFSDQKNMLKVRDQVYRHMISSQLFYDGHQSMAVQLSTLIQAHPPCPPSDRLTKLVSLGLQTEQDEKALPAKGRTRICLDLENSADIANIAPEPATYDTIYVTSHKGNCRVGAFSHDGMLCATGSVDTSIKILDMERMLAKASAEGEAEVGHPVIRTLYDHMEEVSALQFHPSAQVLASGSRDFSVKLFDYSKSTVKKAQMTIPDSAEVNALSFHPSGQYISVATEHNVIRLYNVNTAQCFAPAAPRHNHTSAVVDIMYSADGRSLVSCSKDGTIKLWDGVSNQCVNTLQKAHQESEVCSVQFSKNGKYVLSSGMDSLVKLWELSTSRCLIAYTGAGTTAKQEFRSVATFNHTEDYVIFPDEATISLCCWDARNAVRKKLLSLGHNAAVRRVVHSPIAPAFMSCSDDFRARFWYKRGTIST